MRSIPADSIAPGLVVGFPLRAPVRGCYVRLSEFRAWGFKGFASGWDFGNSGTGTVRVAALGF